MLALLSPLITRGIIDNTENGLIDLSLWFVDDKEPLHLRLSGNCLRDIAGCRIEFSNPLSASVKEVPELINSLRYTPHHYTAGDITFSRRVPDADNRAAISNYLYIEFFVDDEKRVLLEFTAIPFDISLPQWTQSWEEDNLQQLLNMEALRTHIQSNLKQYKGPSLSALRQDMPSCHWDFILNRAEAKMAIYPSIHTKYGTEPGGYLAAAYVMERTAFLGKLATEDEAHLPPDPKEMNRDWEVTDFLEKDQAEAVYRAMHHPLFQEASRVTMLVQQYIIRGNEKIRASKEADAFLGCYAGFVSHLLASLLMADEKDYRAAAHDRLQILMKRLQELETMTLGMPTTFSDRLRQALSGLRENTELLLSSLYL